MCQKDPERDQEILSVNVDDPISLPIEEVLDLHMFRPKEVASLLDDYLKAAQQKGFTEVLIIHGKGQGILRQRVRSILMRNPLVLGFSDAEPGRGGWGACRVFLEGSKIATDAKLLDDDPTRSEHSPEAMRRPLWQWLLGIVFGSMLAALAFVFMF